MTSVVASESFPDLIASPEEGNFDTLEQASDDQPIAPESLPLGSAMELQVDYICAATLAEAEILQEIIEGKQENQLTVRGRLQLQGGKYQRATAFAFVTVETKHCNDHRCFRLQSETGNQVTLRFELNPDVLTNSLPQLDITIRSKRSHKAKLSLSMALGYLLQYLTVGVEFHTKIALLDDQDRLCGRLNTKFRGGLVNDLDNNDQGWKPIMHEPVGCILTLKVFEVQVTGTADKDYVANVWSSAGGKLRGQVVSSLLNGGSSTESQSVSLQVIDVDTEIFFVGIYRFSSHERNDLIGLGRFCGYQLKFSENQTVELCVNLFVESGGKELECGSVMFSLQRSSVPTESQAEKSLAATGLGSIAYPVKTGEMKCRLDVDILEVQTLPANVQQGDCISIQLSVGQSNWKTELAPVKVSVDAGGKMIAIVNENVTSIIRWAAKDRSFPVLEVGVYVKRQQKLSRFGMASKASLATLTHGKRRQAKATQHNINEEAPVLVASGNIHLSPYFLQQNVSALADLNLDLEKTLVDSADSIPGIMSILLRVRASSSQENDSKCPLSPEYFSRVLQPIKGDICIHLLQASGSSLRKSSSPSSYYVSVSTGPQSITSSCCVLDDEYTLIWNQQLAIPIACTRPPVIHLTLHSRKADSIQPDTSSDQIVGYLNLPLFPSILNEDHLLQLELPFGLSASELTKPNNGPHYFKRGLITLEVQFLPIEQPRTDPTPLPRFELLIHHLRGHFLSSEGSQRPCGFTKHIVIEFSILIDRGGVPEELGIGLSRAIGLSATGLTEVEDVIDLSNPTIAATLSNGSNNVLVGRIRDLTGENYGRVHIPLRTDWKERLVNRKKQVWYPVCIASSSGDVTTTTNSVLMSLQLCEQSNQTINVNTLGKFHVNICEAIFTDSASANLMKLAKYGGANIQLTRTSEDPLNVIRCRTRQSTRQDSQRWRWENEWFVFTHEEGTCCPLDLCISLQVSLLTIHPPLEGKLDLLSLVEAAKLRRLDLWISLADQTRDDDATVSAQLHIVVSYVPTIIGTLVLDFGENCALSQPETSLQVENMFYKCKFHGASVSTIVPDDQETTNTTSIRLRLPINTRLVTTVELPRITIQMMGVTKTLGEICIGESSINLLEISELCSLLPSSSESVQVERFIWREFKDKSDQAKTTGIVKLHVGFEEVLVTKQTTGNGKTREKRGVTSAELFTIWKKLFYLLDQNNNGYIDRNEFTDVFVNHLDEMTGTSDGQKLLQLLFGDENNQEDDCTPTQQQISTLFALMDTNRDNEIEWSEYLRFLQQRQQQISTEDENRPEVTSEQKRELRRKNREDRCEPPSTEAIQDELPEKSQEALPTLQQEPAPSKRSGKVSSSEEKRVKLHYSNQEQSRLQQQVAALESILAIERRRYAELAADRQALMRSYQQLHLKHQNELLQEQTKTKWMKQTIERQQQQIEEREQLRRNRNEASIVLQSTVRSRLEQKRYQGLKLQRVNAAVTIQCMIRQVKAKQQSHVLMELDRVVKLRTSCVSKLQRFIRFHVHRKERALLVEARVLSATILQKNARRLLVGRTWRAQKMMVLKLQCWLRQRRAIRNLTQRRNAASTVKYAILSWFTRWKYVQKVKSSRKIQNWWRRASVERSWYMTRVEASLCIQSVWKRRSTRKWFEREWLRQEKYIADLEATICIQAAWRGRRHRSKSVRSRENTPRYNDDSAIEALLYDLVAMVEAGVVIPSVLKANETVVGEEAPENSVSDVHDLPVSSEENEADIQVLGVLNDLVEAVIGADPEGFAVSEDGIELPPDENSGDQNCQDPEIVFQQKINLDDMEKPDPNRSDAVVMIGDNVARDALVHNESPHEKSVSIIRNLLEELVDKTTTMAEVAVPHEYPDDSSRNKLLEGFLQDLVGRSEEDGISGEDSVPQAVNDTGSDALLVTSAEERNNNEVHENEGVIQPNVTNEAAHDTQHESDDNSNLDHHGPDEVAMSKVPQQPVDTELPDVFDTETVEGDLLIPNPSDSDEVNSDNEEADGSSIDSTDLMMEADAMAILQDTPDSETFQ